MSMMKIHLNDNLQERLDTVIPGGSHTYSKGRDVFPSNAPAVLTSGKGCYVKDLNGNKFLDFGMGLKSVIIGYADRTINRAVRNSLALGNNLSRPSMVELLAAEELVEIIPCAEMVKFAKNGSNVTTAALKIARAATGRKFIAVPEEQPFFSFDDWFIGSTSVNKGIPKNHSSLTLKFSYGDISSLRKLFANNAGEIAAVMMEPAVDLIPCKLSHKSCTSKCITTQMKHTEKYLKEVKSLCNKMGAVLIFDEMRTGFRWHFNGAQTLFNCYPDLATFGKSMANGYSVSALVGKRHLMELGSTNKKNSERTFLLSSTHGAEISSLEAFRATAKKLHKEKVSEYLWGYGASLKNEIVKVFESSELAEYIEISGPPISLEIKFKSSEFWSVEQLKTKFYEELVNSKILMPTITPSFSHGNKEIQLLAGALDKVLSKIRLNRKSKSYFANQDHLLSTVFRKIN